MNGGDNTGIYIHVASQVKSVEIAVYIVVYYVVLGDLCLVASLVLRQKHILKVAEKYASFITPFLYIGLGIFIVVKSDCFPWSVHEIHNQFVGGPGRVVMGVTTACMLSCIMSITVWLKMGRITRSVHDESMELNDHEGAPAHIDKNGAIIKGDPNVPNERFSLVAIFCIQLRELPARDTILAQAHNQKLGFWPFALLSKSLTLASYLLK